MDRSDEQRIHEDIASLADSQGDSLRTSQKLFARLISTKDQNEAIQLAIDEFLALTPPQRVMLLQEIELQIRQNRCPCLAFENNERFLRYLLERLLQEVTRTSGRFFKKPVHGTAASIAEISGVIGAIQSVVSEVALDQKALELSSGFTALLDTLTDNQLSRLDLMARRMRDIKACRDPYREVVDQRYIDEQMGRQRPAFQVVDLSDFYAFLRPHEHIVQEIAAMDFQELTFLLDHIADFRSVRFTQGRVR